MCANTPTGCSLTKMGKTERVILDRKRQAVGPIWVCSLRFSSVMRTEMRGSKWSRTELGGHPNWEISFAVEIKRKLLAADQ